VKLDGSSSGLCQIFGSGVNGVSHDSSQMKSVRSNVACSIVFPSDINIKL
jgi:hypothetical protein